MRAKVDPESTYRLWLEPQLASLTSERFSDPGWIFERKLDGVRAIAGRHGSSVALHSRSHREMSDNYPEIADAVGRCGAAEVVLDGEIVAFDGDRTSFSVLQQRLGLTDARRIRDSGVDVVFYVFDLLRLGAEDTRRLPQVERKAMLRAALRWKAPLVFCEHVEEDGLGLYEQASREGWEGIMAKRAAAAYHGGRSRDWLKMKTSREQEFVVGGFTLPDGSRSGLGALLIGYYDRGRFVYAGKVGTGYTQQVLHSLRAGLDQMLADTSPFADPPPEKGACWVEPELVVQVAFSEWTTAGRLRHPSYKGVRDDKDPRDVRRE